MNRNSDHIPRRRSAAADLRRGGNYLKATDIEVCLLLDFGTEPELKRKAFDNLRK